MTRTVGLWLAMLACGWLPCNAQASQSVKLNATLVPERLGHGTTVGFGFAVTATESLVPSPLTAIQLSYPGNLGFALSGLGLDTCAPQTLALAGPHGCPADSHMGRGTAVAEVPFGPLVVRESAAVTIVRAPTQEGKLALLFYADAISPVSAQIVFPGLLAPAPAPFGGQVDIDVPLVPGFPGGSDIAIVQLRSTLGPQHLTYFHRAGGKTVAYNPRGVLLPKVCPPGGFRFAGTFTFLDGSTASAQTSVRCPATIRARMRSQHDERGRKSASTQRLDI